MAICPQCSMEVKEGARKCPHCKSFLDPQLAAARQLEDQGLRTDVPRREEPSGTSFLVQGVIELLFAGLTLVLGWIVGVLTVAFALYFAFKAFAWNARFREATGHASASAVAGGVISIIAAIVAGILTWYVLQQ